VLRGFHHGLQPYGTPRGPLASSEVNCSTTHLPFCKAPSSSANLASSRAISSWCGSALVGAPLCVADVLLKLSEADGRWRAAASSALTASSSCCRAARLSLLAFAYSGK
jgi:hypothetical protein